MLTATGISFYYNPDRYILKDVSLDLGEKDILCLLGPNGTGKTTLLRCLLMLNKMKTGSISVAGQDLAKIPVRNRAKYLAYVPQAINMAFPYDGFEIVQMGRVAHLAPGSKPNKKDQKIAMDSMERLGIKHLAEHSFNEMSGGERQMVLVARALAQQARILVMDEPTANLDYGNQIKILKTIKQLAEDGYAILMTSHYPDHAFLACNRAMLLRDGKILAEGKPEKIVTTGSLSHLYNTPVCVTKAILNSFNKTSQVCIPLMH